MKREFWLSCLCAAVLGTVLSFSGIGCVITAFDLDVGSMLRLFAVCLCFSAAGAVCFRLKWGGAALLCFVALLTGLLVREGEALTQTYGVIEKISRIYNRAYGWGYLNLGGSSGAVYPMAAVGVLAALTVSGTVSTGKSPWLAVTVSLLPLLLCFVVTDTVPEEGYLFALMAGLAVLILTASVRMKAPEQGNLLTALVAAPVILALAVLFLLNPKESYVNRSGDFQQSVEQWLEQLPQRLEDIPQLWEEMLDSGTLERPEDRTDSVDLRDVGPKSEQTYEVMDVSSTTGGTLYLRGQDFDFYSGTGWRSTSRQGEAFPGGACVMRSTGTVTVETRRLRDVLYLPYYPMEQEQLVSGKVYNTDGEKRYTFTAGALANGWQAQSTDGLGVMLTVAQSHGDARAKELYLNLPEDTKEQARQLLGKILIGAQSRREKAEAIAYFVQNSARYDLDTPKMPPGESDFALWFLNESNTGYCVHFATAAAVLLRAADIPARYVTGYMAQVTPGETVTVTAAGAHAWVEYYEPVLDAWIVLEATPPDGQTPETQPSTQPAPTETPTVPIATEPTETEGTEQTEQTAEPTEAPTEETFPQTPEEPKKLTVPGWLKSLVLWMLTAGALVLALIGQRMLRLALKKRRLRERAPNALALKLWREAVLLSRLLGQDRPPRELEKLAQKAKYSQHTLTEGELDRLGGYLEESCAALKERPWYRQLLYRYLYVVY